MTEFPALRDALVRAGRRRRRRRLTLGAAVPAFAAAAAAVTLFALPARTPDPEQAAPAPRDRFEQIFRRPRVAADALPAELGVTGVEDRARSRLISRRGKVAFYAVPTVVRGSDWLCLIAVDPGRGNEAACGQLAKMLSEEIAPGVVFKGWFGFLFRDGTRDVRLTFADGRRLPAPIHSNLASGIGDGPIEITSWTGPSGRRHIVSTVNAALFQRPASCPRALDPLPPDAEAAARRAALLAVDHTYAEVVEADVTAVKRGGGPCGRAISDRTIEVGVHLTQRGSASLSQGRLLVGMVDGDMQVYCVVD
jgi:hypothetical protein